MERRKASAQRSARAAPRSVRLVDYASFGVPPPFFFLLEAWLEALIVTAQAPPPDASDEDRCGERTNLMVVTNNSDAGASRERGGLQ